MISVYGLTGRGSGCAKWPASPPPAGARLVSRKQAEIDALAFDLDAREETLDPLQ